MSQWKTQIEKIDELAAPVQTIEEAQVLRPVRRSCYPQLIIRDDGGSGSGEVIRLRTGSLAIGRSEGDLTFPSESLMSAQHCRFRMIQQSARQVGWVIEDLQSRHGTYLRCAEVLLSPGMEFILGGTRFRLLGTNVPVEFSSNPATSFYFSNSVETSAEQRLEVCSFAVDQTTSYISLNQKVIEIGRLTHPNLATDPFIEPIHIKLEKVSNGCWKATDCKSLNGLWVRIVSAQLQHGSQVAAGEQQFVFQLS